MDFANHDNGAPSRPDNDNQDEETSNGITSDEIDYFLYLMMQDDNNNNGDDDDNRDGKSPFKKTRMNPPSNNVGAEDAHVSATNVARHQDERFLPYNGAAETETDVMTTMLNNLKESPPTPMDNRNELDDTKPTAEATTRVTTNIIVKATSAVPTRATTTPSLVVPENDDSGKAIMNEKEDNEWKQHQLKMILQEMFAKAQKDSDQGVMDVVIKKLAIITAGANFTQEGLLILNHIRDEYWNYVPMAIRIHNTRIQPGNEEMTLYLYRWADLRALSNYLLAFSTQSWFFRAVVGLYKTWSSIPKRPCSYPDESRDMFQSDWLGTKSKKDPTRVIVEPYYMLEKSKSSRETLAMFLFRDQYWKLKCLEASGKRRRDSSEVTSFNAVNGLWEATHKDLCRVFPQGNVRDELGKVKAKAEGNIQVPPKDDEKLVELVLAPKFNPCNSWCFDDNMGFYRNETRKMQETYGHIHSCSGFILDFGKKLKSYEESYLLSDKDRSLGENLHGLLRKSLYELKKACEWQRDAAKQANDK